MQVYPRGEDPLSMSQKTRAAERDGSRGITARTSSSNGTMPVVFSHRPKILAR